MDGMVEVLRLVKFAGEIKGRKKLQKIVHILKSLGYDFPQRFGYLHYGPYSSALAAEVDALVSSGLLLQQGGDAAYDPYVYRTADAMDSLFGELGLTDEPTWSDLAKWLNGKDANTLESMSTIRYLIDNGFSGHELKNRFSQLKPNLAGLYEDAMREVQALEGSRCWESQPGSSSK